MVKKYGPNRDSEDRVNLPKTGWAPGEVSSDQLRDVLQFSTDWVEALGWRDRPRVTLDALFAACQYVGTKHGYRIDHDRAKVQCRCGSPVPCPDFETMRVLMTVLDIEGPLGNGLALAKVQLDAAHQTNRLDRRQFEREIGRLRIELENSMGTVSELESELGVMESRYRLANRRYAEEQVRADGLSQMVRAFARRSTRQLRKIRALLEPEAK